MQSYGKHSKLTEIKSPALENIEVEEDAEQH